MTSKRVEMRAGRLDGVAFLASQDFDLNNIVAKLPSGPE